MKHIIYFPSTYYEVVEQFLSWSDDEKLQWAKRHTDDCRVFSPKNFQTAFNGGEISDEGFICMVEGKDPRTICQCYEEIKQREIAELKERVRPYGWVRFIRDTDWDEYDDADENKEHFIVSDGVFVMVNDGEPHDEHIVEVSIQENDRLCIIAQNEGEDYIVSLEDIAYGHIDFITSAIKAY